MSDDPPIGDPPPPSPPPAPEPEPAPEPRRVGRPLGKKDSKPRTLSDRAHKANAIRAWKNGTGSHHPTKGLVTEREGRLAVLARIDPTLPALIEAAVKAVGGDMEDWQAMAASTLVEMEVLRRVCMDAIHRDGVVVEDVTVQVARDAAGGLQRDPETGRIIRGDADENAVIRLKAHPLIEATRRFHTTLGFTGEEMRMTKRSRGAGAVDDAAAALLKKRALLQAGRGRMLPPPEPIDVTGK